MATTSTAGHQQQPQSTTEQVVSALTPPSTDEMVTASKQLVRRNPMTASLTAFGIGIGVGVLAGAALVDAALAARARREPDGYGEQLYAALRRMAPSSFER